MLGQEELDYFRGVFSQQLEELLGKSSHTVAELLINGDKLADYLDKASFEASRGTTLRLRDRESQLIRKITAALERIEDGTFGVCELCGRKISIARLRARPVTSHCIRCKTKMELNEGSHRALSGRAALKRVA